MRKYFNIFISFLFAVVVCACSDDQDTGKFTPLNPEISFVEESQSVGKEGGDITLRLNSNLPWRVKSDQDWVTFITENGMSSEGEFIVNVQKNGTLSERTATITAWIDGDSQQTMTIVQAPSELSDLVKNYYVKVGGDASKDGLSWENSTTLENAMENAVHGDFIHIAAGSYAPSIALSGGDVDNVSDKTFEISNNISLIGGYPEDAQEGAVVDPVANPTILSGILSGGRAYHVVTVTAPKIDGYKVAVSGLQIKNGQAAISGTGSVTVNGAILHRFYGGGLVVGNAVAEFTDCIVADNESGAHGAGAFITTNSRVSFERCSIINNSTSGTSSNCGGLYNSASTVYMNNCTVAGNTCTGVAAGIYAYDILQLSPTYTYIYNSTIANNNNNAANFSKTRAAGGFYGREFSTSLLVNCTFYGNIGGNGGAISLYGTAAKGSKMDLVSCTIVNNTALTKCGGVLVNPNGTTMSIYNSVISGNTATVDNDVTGNYALSYGIISAAAYDKDGAEVAGSNFDPTSMLGVPADNGGYTLTCLMLGDNPAKLLGMPREELVTLGAEYVPALGAEIIGSDQTGTSREGKTVIGACVK